MSLCLILVLSVNKMAANMMYFVSAALFAATTVFFRLFNSIQPDPYMDEIFHIPQAQNYCAGNFSHWNNKITTLPGLYIVSITILRFRSYVPILGTYFDSDNQCSASFLRAGNMLFVMLNFWLLFELSRMINTKQKAASAEQELQSDTNKKGKKRKVSGMSKQDKDNDFAASVRLTNHSFANAFVLSLFPLLYFFAFLYYTDQGSTFMVLLTYWFSLQDSHINAALAGSVAVCFRQTNIVWVAFVGAVSLLKEIEYDIPDIEDGVRCYIEKIFNAVRQKMDVILQKAIPYALIGITFCIFIIKNNGIVVGDRSSHQPCFNAPQIFYFIAFTMACSFPHFISRSSIQVFCDKARKLVQCKTKMMLALICLLAMIFIISKFTYVHEYLLADNRHYTFYIWRKLFIRHWMMKYLCIPFYIYGGYLMYFHLSVKNSQYFIILLTTCVVLVTIPQKLLEFRYFIIPYLFFRLHVQLPSYTLLALELAFYVALNGVTIFLFLYKPFLWDNDASTQRFMW